MVWKKCLLFLLILPLASVTISTAYAAPAPDPPTALTGIPGNGQVTLSWSAPTNIGDGAASITDYIIEFKLSTDNSFLTFSDGVSSSTGATVTGLTNGNLYFFSVKAKNNLAATSVSAFVGLQPSATPPSFTFVAPPTLSQSVMDAMIALGLPSNFVMPSATIASSTNFNPFDSSFNQKLEFTTPFNPTGGDVFTSYSIQTYSKPTLAPGQVWVVPSSVIPVTGGIGDIAATKLNEIPPNTPTFIQQTGAALANGAVAAQGLKLNLAGTATGVNVQTQILSTPPSGAPAGANFYLDYTFTGTGVNFGSEGSYSSSPEQSFTMAPVAGSVHPTNPTNSVNSAIICPNVQLALVQSGVEVTTGITITRDTAGDTSTACGYKGILLHFSTYTGRAIGSASANCNGDCTPPTLGVDSNGFRFVSEGFTINGKSFDVNDYFLPTELQTLHVGTPNNVILKIYDNSGAKAVAHASFCMGIPTGSYTSDTCIIWDNTWNQQQSFYTIDKDKILSNVSAEGKIDENLMVVSIGFTVDDTLTPAKFGTTIWDQYRNSWNNYFNHGLEVVGQPRDNGIITVTDGSVEFALSPLDNNPYMRIDQNNNIWVMLEDFHWTKLRNGVGLDDKEISRVNVFDREHPWFSAYKIEQALLAEQTLKEICELCFDTPFDKLDNIKSFELPLRFNNKLEDPEIQLKLLHEQRITQERLDSMFKTLYGNRPVD
ncbi:MAG: fibronectin type III domain-containing protein [Nitrosopumilaceae archaeon]